MSESNTLKSTMGACFPGSHTIFRGHDLHKELSDLSWVELYVLGITGRRLSPEHTQLLNHIWTYTSYPDARIWNNRVAALAGKTKSTGVLGVSAALAVSEARIYGKGTDVFSSYFLIRVDKALLAGNSLLDILQKELLKYRYILGYGRPIAGLQVDERIPAITCYMETLGIQQGRYLQLAFEIEQGFSQLGKALVANYAIVAAALLLDMGLSPEESYHCMHPCFVAGMLPCYIEQKRKVTQRSLFSLSCADIVYKGHERRVWKGVQA